VLRPAVEHIFFFFFSPGPPPPTLVSFVQSIFKVTGRPFHAFVLTFQTRFCPKSTVMVQNYSPEVSSPLTFCFPKSRACAPLVASLHLNVSPLCPLVFDLFSFTLGNFPTFTPVVLFAVHQSRVMVNPEARKRYLIEEGKSGTSCAAFWRFTGWEVFFVFCHGGPLPLGGARGLIFLGVTLS